MVDEVLLTDVPKGQTATIVAVTGPDADVVTRLSHLGFLPGTKIKVIRHAPLGDPTVYELRGNQMSLRRRESSMVTVKTEASA